MDAKRNISNKRWSASSSPAHTGQLKAQEKIVLAQGCCGIGIRKFKTCADTELRAMRRELSKAGRPKLHVCWPGRCSEKGLVDNINTGKREYRKSRSVVAGGRLEASWMESGAQAWQC